MGALNGGTPKPGANDHPASLRRPACRSMAITSGKGGVGKTNIAANLAVALARKNRRVLLVDGDLGLANLDLLLGVMPQYTLLHVVSGEKSLEEIIVPTFANVKLVPAASAAEDLANLDDFRRECFLRTLSTVDQDVDLILLDLGAGIGKNVTSLALAADEIVIVTTPEPTSVSQAYAMMKVLAAHRGVPDFKIVVNMADSASQAQQVYERICKVSGQFLKFAPENWGYIENDPAVKRAVMNHEPFLVASPRSEAACAIERLSQRVLDIEPGPKNGLNEWLDRLKEAQAG